MKRVKKVTEKKKTVKKKAVKKRNTLKKAVNNRKNEFPVVGIGGSAGSLQEFEKFFKKMPPDAGIAFVVIMHLDPNHKARVAELLQNYTSMPVVEVIDGTPLKPDHIYVIPPNKDIGLHNSKLVVTSASRPKGYPMPIDHFFQSLAEDQWSRAVGIIFSGMGSDGETGIRMIKEKLGMVMVQDPGTSQYSSMPNSSIGTGQVDYIVPSEEMPFKLTQYLKHPALFDSHNHQAMSDARNGHSFHKILMILRSQTGHDFSLYKKNTIMRRIDRRIAYHQLSDYPAYVEFLRNHPAEVTLLFNELLIGVTKFFRDSDAYESLKKHLNRLLDEKKENEPVRVWVAGCSTGEEAYSIAILLMEYIRSTDTIKPSSIQIFATDLDNEAIEHARQGFYLENIMADVSAARLERFFNKKNDGYQVKKELREMIVFAQHNLTKDAPFTRLDLLSCRNMMIYFTNELQNKLIPVFHYSLNQKGLLFLGPAETVGEFTDMFRALDSKWRISQRIENSSSSSRLIDFPFNISANIHHLKPDGKSLKKNSLQERFQKVLLEDFTPPSILINEKGDILYINGKMGKFLELSSGEAVMNIHHVVREELKYAVSNAVHQARIKKSTIDINNIKIKDKGETSYVNIKVAYIDDLPLQDPVLILFEDAGRGEVKGKKNLKRDNSRLSIVDELEKELLFTKQQLHSTIEQMETSVEELKSTNEELQSTNEELQSTNEESLTTKEEMQSLNEELMTINMQYQAKAEELTQLNNDMKNLLDSTQIATVFLDNDMNILRFTPQVKKLFNIIQGDIGRSITHVVSNFEHKSLKEDIREVLDKLKGKEIDVKTKSGEWYNLRILPYRTLDNFISGAILTFNQVTSLKEIESKYMLTVSSWKTLMNAINYPCAVVNPDRNILAANQKFNNMFDVKDAHGDAANIGQLFSKSERVKIDGWFKEAHVRNNKYETEIKRGHKKYSLSFEAIKNKKSDSYIIFLKLIEASREKRKK